ncbi:uncharacterized protein RJT20DRAFT_137610 [Scheffersomyces xylosifermentans]|uniref:uncharacterized protein n=1 Tax=Scheffersomyces xylosifermentans TaxID=1304137 RepID=UPI00315D75D0
MTSEEFKSRYLNPLSGAIDRANITGPILHTFYKYPPRSDKIAESYIQEYFDSSIAPSIRSVYEYACRDLSAFGKGSFKPPVFSAINIEPDFSHLWKGTTYPTGQYPEFCFRIGDYKRRNYKLGQGVRLMVSSVTSFRGRSVLYEGRFFFPSLAQPNDWSPERAFAILIRKYVVYGVLCGTNRIFLSDHETFSGFFVFQFDEHEQMTILL